jgi:hypothetical protein
LSLCNLERPGGAVAASPTPQLKSLIKLTKKSV